jgi:hypothetical protein
VTNVFLRDSFYKGFEILTAVVMKNYGIYRRVTFLKSSDVSEEYVAFVFKDVEQAKQETCMKQSTSRANFG